MSERIFNQTVLNWCKRHVMSMQSRNRRMRRTNFGRVVVQSRARIKTGWLPWHHNLNSADWDWQEFPREIDIVIGLKVNLDDEEYLIPLMAIEIKAGPFSTDELDKKGSIYSSLKETYPWVLNIFLLENYDRGGPGERHFIRNSRHFDYVYTDWDRYSKQMLGKLIDYHLEYTLSYWEL